MSPTDPTQGPAVVVVRLADLLPDLREAVEKARTSTGWDAQLLRRALAGEFDFLGPYIEAEVVAGRATPSPAGPADETLVIRFTPPSGGRDIVGAERTFQRATQQAERGDVKGALRDLERITKAVPEVAKYHRAVGQAYLVLGQHDEAEDSFLRALRLDPTDPDALTLLGNLYAQRGKHADAIPLYERSLGLRRNVYALNNLAAAMARLGRQDEAVALFREALEEDFEYPNAHYGLALALAQTQDPAVLPEAIDALETALAFVEDRKRDPAVWDASRNLLAQLSTMAADQQVATAGDVVRAELVERETASASTGDPAVPVRIEQADLGGGILAKIELAWVHRRPYHRLLVGAQAGPEREHLVLHELEHLRLAEAARAAGTNRWFVSTGESWERANAAIRGDVDRLGRKGFSESESARFVESALHGLLGQLFNFPLDLLIETRLLARHPSIRELLFQSVERQLVTAAKIANDTRLRSFTPSKIFKANAAMNAAMALWLEERFPLRTDLVDQFRGTDAFSTGRRLYQHWEAAAPRWVPGAEYDWVDEWAEMLGLRGWYGWTDGNPQEDRAPEPEHRAGQGGGSESALAPAQEMAATFFMLAAMEWIEDRPPREVAEMAAKAALVGRGGIRYQDPASRYDLAGYANEPISGLQLLSTMYVLVKAVAPDADQGIDLDGPYAAAQQMYRAKRGGAEDGGDSPSDQVF